MERAFHMIGIGFECYLHRRKNFDAMIKKKEEKMKCKGHILVKFYSGKIDFWISSTIAPYCCLLSSCDEEWGSNSSVVYCVTRLTDGRVQHKFKLWCTKLLSVRKHSAGQLLITYVKHFRAHFPQGDHYTMVVEQTARKGCDSQVPLINSSWDYNASIIYMIARPFLLRPGNEAVHKPDKVANGQQ